MVTLGNTIMVNDLDDRSGNPSGPSWRWDPLQGGGLQHRCLQQIRLYQYSVMFCYQVVLSGYVLEDNILVQFLEYLRTLLTCDGHKRAYQGTDGLLGSSPRVLIYDYNSLKFH